MKQIRKDNKELREEERVKRNKIKKVNRSKSRRKAY